MKVRTGPGGMTRTPFHAGTRDSLSKGSSVEGGCSISHSKRDGTARVNLRMVPARALVTECKYKCGETAGVLTLPGTSPLKIQMDRPRKTPGHWAPFLLPRTH